MKKSIFSFKCSYLLFSSLLLLLSSLSQADNFVVTKGSKLAGISSTFTACVFDHEGNLYAVGTFGGENAVLDVDPDPLVELNMSVSDENILITKYSPNGKLIWARKLANDFDDISVNGIVWDAKTKTIILTGNFIEKMDFDPGAGTHFLEDENHQAFVLKLTENGNFLWAKQTSTLPASLASSVHPRDIAVDSSGNIVIVGNFGNRSDFNPGAEVAELPSSENGTDDVFIWKLNQNGGFVWVKSLGNTQETNFKKIANGDQVAVDNVGNVCVAGSFSKVLDVDPGDAILNLDPNGESDVFVVKLTAQGEFMWAKQVGGSLSEKCGGLAIDRAGSVIFAGSFLARIDLDPGAGFAEFSSHGDEDGYIVKLDRDGNFTWARQIGGTGRDVITALVLNFENISQEPFTSEEIQIGGSFTGTVDFDPEGGVELMTGTGLNTFFYEKLSPAGSMLWARKFNGGGNNVSFNKVNNMATDQKGDVAIVGHHEGSVDFDPGLGFANDFSPNALSINSFAVKVSGRNGLLRAITPNFNFDLKTDILFQNTQTGKGEIWLMNGFQKLQGGVKIQKEGFVPSPNWQMAAVGDFNKDIHSDVLMENTVTGEREIWLMNATFNNTNKVDSVISLGVIDLAWQIAATGEFSDDGNTDIVWQNKQTGERLVWFMYGTTPFDVAFLPAVSKEWKIVGTGFFDDNERTDLIWQNTVTKEKVIWTMDGVNIQSPFSFGVAGNWEFVGTGFFNDDNRSDLILENKGTQQRVIWFPDPSFNSEVKIKNAAALPNFSSQFEVRNR